MALWGSPQPVAVKLTGTATPKRGRPKSKGIGLSETTVANCVCTLFGGIAVATGHKHWVKTHEKIKPITGPLTEMLNGLDPEILEKLQRHVNPALLVYGIAQVVVPDIMVEVEFRKGLKKARAEAVRTPIPQGPPPVVGTASPETSPIQPVPDI